MEDASTDTTPAAPATLTVDWADVLRQAVDNEHWRTIRAARAAVEAVDTTEPDWRYPRTRTDRNVDGYRKDVLAALEAAEKEVDHA
ncbi:hypothetical protein ACQCX2_07665 [Propionibacteriaceae bacterium Y1700]|uniref:hypothetical protein n=1 Tax=Microlunatus sp. Y1700 TaxID=3418487 RepID=UPI003DA7599F